MLTERDSDPASVMINMRVPTSKRDLIDRAAKVAGKSRTEFVIDAAYKAAEDALLDQRVFYLDEANHKRFLQMLDEPVADQDQLHSLVVRKAPWET